VTRSKEEEIKERMDHFKDLAQQLMKIRKSGPLPARKSERSER
jgi:hypothetical protein